MFEYGSTLVRGNSSGSYLPLLPHHLPRYLLLLGVY